MSSLLATNENGFFGIKYERIHHKASSDAILGIKISLVNFRCLNVGIARVL